MALDTCGVSVSLILRMEETEEQIAHGPLTTDAEAKILADAEVHARLLAFRRLRDPFSRHQLKSAICTRHGMRSDMADRLIKKAASAVTRRG